MILFVPEIYFKTSSSKFTTTNLFELEIVEICQLNEIGKVSIAELPRVVWEYKIILLPEEAMLLLWVVLAWVRAGRVEEFMKMDLRK